MKIRILTAKPGYSAGDVKDVPNAEAFAWLGSGDAELPDAKPGDSDPKRRREVVERAMANPRGEKAVKV